MSDSCVLASEKSSEGNCRQKEGNHDSSLMLLHSGFRTANGSVFLNLTYASFPLGVCDSVSSAGYVNLISANVMQLEPGKY